MTPQRKVVVVAAMFAISVVLVFVASATRSTVPLFVMFIPLLVVPWALTRREPAEAVAEEGAAEAGPGRSDLAEPDRGDEA